MITRIDHENWEIRADDRWTIEVELSIAESAAQHDAVALGCGINVVQLSSTTFTLTISPDVPFGQTLSKMLKNT